MWLIRGMSPGVRIISMMSYRYWTVLSSRRRSHSLPPERMRRRLFLSTARAGLPKAVPVRVLTSAKTRQFPSRQTRSISPLSLNFQLRRRMFQPEDLHQEAAIFSPKEPIHRESRRFSPSGGQGRRWMGFRKNGIACGAGAF